MKKALIICLFFISCSEAPKRLKKIKHVETTPKVLHQITDIVETEITKLEFEKSISTYHNRTILDSAVYASVKGKQFYRSKMVLPCSPIITVCPMMKTGLPTNIVVA